MVKNIVFDIGNVLVDYRLKEFLAQKGYDEKMIRRIVKASVVTPYWSQFERGEITEEEAIKAFAGLDPEIEKDIYRAYDNIQGMLTLRDYAIPWIKELRDAGYHVYYLSNYSKKACEECKDSLAFIEYMEGGLFSYQEKMTKPNPKFYMRFLEEFNLIADECIYIDDTDINVHVAKEIGFHGILFRSYESTKEQLKAFI